MQNQADLKTRWRRSGGQCAWFPIQAIKNWPNKSRIALNCTRRGNHITVGNEKHRIEQKLTKGGDYVVPLLGTIHLFDSNHCQLLIFPPPLQFFLFGINTIPRQMSEVSPDTAAPVQRFLSW